mmetsp:Transcript_30765/g.70399  ORF Transcript_30765/g.70399 Transcript_30765/m.70399 type:complete len:143 (+) Transcript_30765:96-524(+)
MVRTPTKISRPRRQIVTKMFPATVLWVAAAVVRPVEAFVSLPSFPKTSNARATRLRATPDDLFSDVMRSVAEFWSNVVPFSDAVDEADASRKRLKNGLLSLVRTSGTSTDRSEVEDIIADLAALSPNADAARSALLRKKWLL